LVTWFVYLYKSDRQLGVAGNMLT